MKRLIAPVALVVAACTGSAGTAVDLPDGPPGIGFDDLRYSERLGKVLVPGGRSGALDLIDPATLEVTSISGFTAIDDYAGGHDDSVTSVDDNGRWLLATDRTAGRIEVVDPDRRAIVAGATLGGHPDYVRWVAETEEAWVTEPGREEIEIFTLAEDGTPTRTGSVEVDGGPESLVIDPVRHRAYTHLWDGATVAVDLESHEIVATWPNGCGGSRGIALDPELGFLFVACQEGKLVLLDVEHDGEQLAEVWPVDGSDVIDYSPALRHVYTAGQISATVAVVGVSSDGELAILGEQDAALGSHCVVGDGRGGIYVCDPDEGRILVRDDAFDPISSMGRGI
jgi:DNA-binding beta-propeller fold protein YncE